MMLRKELLLAPPPAIGDSTARHTRLLKFLQKPESNPELVKAIATQDGRLLKLSQFLESASIQECSTARGGIDSGIRY
jgi:hypothetical protein